MTPGTGHQVRPDLHLIEGHHPHNLWDDPHLPTTPVYRSASRLYLLDTGAGPVQRDALRLVAEQYRDQVSDILLLNSHGHLEHLGNNGPSPTEGGPVHPAPHPDIQLAGPRGCSGQPESCRGHGAGQGRTRRILSLPR
jgi:glyoxylase-like metal-dependent hydrolase (beta-lactamase superfamily II)